MALTADKVRKIRTRMTMALKVADGVQVYGGSFMALRGPEHATAADRGYAAPWTAGAGEILLGGFAERPVLGDTDAQVPPEVQISADGFVLEKVAVTGVSAITDMLAPVYLSDDDTLTLTRPARGRPIGVVIRWFSGTTCDVYCFGFAEIVTSALAGGGSQLLFLGSIELGTTALNNPGGAKVNLRTGIPAPFAGRILSVFAQVDVAVAGGTGDTALLNLEIDGVDVTGGVVTATAGDAQGTKLAGTAVTANNRFVEGSLIDVEGIDGATGDDLTAGRIDLYAVVEPLLGA